MVCIGDVSVAIGDFVIVEPIAEGVKVKAEIVHILYPLQMKHLKHIGMWYFITL
jgi:probable RNA-binding protein EIF1AD